MLQLGHSGNFRNLFLSFPAKLGLPTAPQQSNSKARAPHSPQHSTSKARAPHSPPAQYQRSQGSPQPPSTVPAKPGFPTAPQHSTSEARAPHSPQHSTSEARAPHSPPAQYQRSQGSPQPPSTVPAKPGLPTAPQHSTSKARAPHSPPSTVPAKPGLPSAEPAKPGLPQLPPSPPQCSISHQGPSWGLPASLQCQKLQATRDHHGDCLPLSSARRSSQPPGTITGTAYLSPVPEEAPSHQGPSQGLPASLQCQKKLPATRDHHRDCLPLSSTRRSSQPPETITGPACHQ